MFCSFLYAEQVTEYEEVSYSQAYKVGESYSQAIMLKAKDSSVKEQKLMCQIYINTITLPEYFKKEALKSCFIGLGSK